MAARPFENAFLHWVLDGGHGPYAPDELVLDRKRDGSVRGVIYYGAQLVVAADDPAALDAFAIETRKYPALRSFVGPKRAVDGIWNRVKSWHRPPLLVRERQPLYALWPQGLGTFDDAGVRLARSDETELVAEHSARMILGELGYDPRAARMTHPFDHGDNFLLLAEQAGLGSADLSQIEVRGLSIEKARYPYD